MDLGRIAGLSILVFGVAGAAMAAEDATLADAAEHGKGPLVRDLLDAGANVNAAQADGMTGAALGRVPRRRRYGRAAGTVRGQCQRREPLRRGSEFTRRDEQKRGPRQAPARRRGRREHDSSRRGKPSS